VTFITNVSMDAAKDAARALAIMRIFILFFAMTSSTAFACSIYNISDEERYNTSKAIYIGYVTAIHATDFEEIRKESTTKGILETVIIPEEFKLRILIKETVKGKKRKTVEVAAGLCNSGNAELKEKVKIYLYRNGASYIEALQ